VRVHGKWLQAGEERYTVRGVTYGPFRSENAEGGFPDRRVVDRDFAAMRKAGLNSLRTYTIPPRWLLDLALAHGLRVMVGIPWEEHIAFLGSRKAKRRIERVLRAAIAEHSGHPAVMAWVIGNEIPAGIVRWHGARAIERFLEHLYLVAKREAPDTPCTYVNYPTTEHLDLPFLDFVCFNVFLQERDDLAIDGVHLLAVAHGLTFGPGGANLNCRSGRESLQFDRTAKSLLERRRQAVDIGADRSGVAGEPPVRAVEPRQPPEAGFANQTALDASAAGDGPERRLGGGEEAGEHGLASLSG